MACCVGGGCGVGVADWYISVLTVLSPSVLSAVWKAKRNRKGGKALFHCSFISPYFDLGVCLPFFLSSCSTTHSHTHCGSPGRQIDIVFHRFIPFFFLFCLFIAHSLCLYIHCVFFILSLSLSRPLPFTHSLDLLCFLTMSNAVILRLQKELSEFSKNPDHQLFLHYGKTAYYSYWQQSTGTPFEVGVKDSNSVLFFWSCYCYWASIDDSDIMNIKAMITGPPDTP